MKDEVIDKLHENEVKILKALERKDNSNIQELKEMTGLVKDAVEKASLWAKVKGVIKIEEESTHYVKITKEGLEYIKEGLPEKVLLEIVNMGKTKISDLRKKMKRFSVGLVWAKKNGWINIVNGHLEITNKGKEYLNKKIDEEIMLSKLKENKKRLDEFDIKTAKKLLKRGLIKKKTKVKKEISLTDLGKKILPELKLEEGIGQLTPSILVSGEWKEKKIRPYDISFPVTKTYPGKKHYMTQVIEYIRRIWLDLGFKEMTGPILDISFWNFDALYQPQDHPARDMADTFYIKNPEKGKLPNNDTVEAVKATHENGWTCNSKGWQYKWDPEFARTNILRTHTTSLSVRTLAKLKEEDLPAKFFSVGRCFRNETLDWKHLAEFYQTDGIVVGEDVTFKNLLGYLKRYFSKLGFPKARFRPAYFPYTEMSTEVEVFHPVHKEWIELGGAGMFRPEVVKPLLGKDIPVLAWGPGFGRLVMMNYGIKDIRELYWNDLKQLREAKMWFK
jgi:phenylalanyl-tRNA synthetase alpha chain